MATFRSQVTAVYFLTKMKSKTAQTLNDLEYSNNNKAKAREVKSETQILGSDDWSNDRARIEKIYLATNECLNSRAYQEFVEYYVLGTVFTPYGPTTKTVYQMFENIISLYNIEAYVVWNEIEDSATSITPVQQDLDMHTYAGILIKEMKKFPYTLYKSLDLRIITFCGSMKLMKPGYSNIFIKKYYNWLFMVNEQKSQEEIHRHFLNTVCYNIVNKSRGFSEAWEKLNPQKPQKNQVKIILPPGAMKPGYLNPKCYNNPIMDQFEVFSALIACPSTLLNHSDPIVAQKGKMFLKAMCKLDREGINNDWLERNGFTTDNSQEEEEDLIFQNK